MNVPLFHYFVKRKICLLSPYMLKQKKKSNIMYCYILGALGCVSTRHPSAPRGPNSVMFIQFSAKILPNNRFLPLFQGLVSLRLEKLGSATDITSRLSVRTIPLAYLKSKLCTKQRSGTL